MDPRIWNKLGGGGFPITPYILHDAFGGGSTALNHYLPIIVPGKGTMRLVSVTQIDAGTDQANAVYSFNRAQGLAFDTSASSTALGIGACNYLQQDFSGNLFLLACHRLLEILAAKVECFGSVSICPEILYSE